MHTGVGRGREFPALSDAEVRTVELAPGRHSQLVHSASTDTVWVLNDDLGTVSVVDVAHAEMLTTIAGTVPAVSLWIDESANTAFLASGEDSCDVVELSSGRVVATIALPAGSQPCLIAPRPWARQVCILGSGGAVLTVDTDDLTVRRVVEHGPTPSSATCVGRRKLYVTSRRHDLVTVVDPGAEPVTSSIPCGRGPIGSMLHVERGMLYVANEDDHTMTKIRVADDAVVATVNLDIDPFRIASVQAITGRPELWVLGRGSGGLAGGIRVVDGVGGSVSRRIEGLTYPSDWVFWKDLAIVVDMDRHLLVLDVTGERLLGELGLPHDPDMSGAPALAVSPAGHLFMAPADAALMMLSLRVR